MSVLITILFYIVGPILCLFTPSVLVSTRKLTFQLFSIMAIAATMVVFVFSGVAAVKFFYGLMISYTVVQLLCGDTLYYHVQKIKEMNDGKTDS